MEDEISLLDIAKIIYHYRLFIAGLVLVSLVFTLIISLSFRAPRQYVATATILPIGGGAATGLSQLLGNMPAGFGMQSFMRGAGSGGTLTAILKSKTLAKMVIEELGLLKVIYAKQWQEETQSWKPGFVPSLESGAMYLSGQLQVKVNTEGVYEISTVGPTPDLAMRIANTYVEKLGEYLVQNAFDTSFKPLDPALSAVPRAGGSLRQKLLFSTLGSLFVSLLLSFLINYSKNFSWEAVTAGSMDKKERSVVR